VDFGEAFIYVRYLGVPSGGFLIYVAPDGTYILQGGCVQDPNHNCLADARVEIIGGPISGRVTMTDQDGDWMFIGVTDVVQVRVSKAGYITVVQDVAPPAGQSGVWLCGPVLAPNGSTEAIPRPVCS
jgi:hypothetical protein